MQSVSTPHTEYNSGSNLCQCASEDENFVPSRSWTRGKRISLGCIEWRSRNSRHLCIRPTASGSTLLKQTEYPKVYALVENKLENLKMVQNKSDWIRGKYKSGADALIQKLRMRSFGRDKMNQEKKRSSSVPRPSYEPHEKTDVMLKSYKIVESIPHSRSVPELQSHFRKPDVDRISLEINANNVKPAVNVDTSTFCSVGTCNQACELTAYSYYFTQNDNRLQFKSNSKQIYNFITNDDTNSQYVHGVQDDSNIVRVQSVVRPCINHLAVTSNKTQLVHNPINCSHQNIDGSPLCFYQSNRDIPDSLNHEVTALFPRTTQSHNSFNQVAAFTSSLKEACNNLTMEIKKFSVQNEVIESFYNCKSNLNLSSQTSGRNSSCSIMDSLHYLTSVSSKDSALGETVQTDSKESTCDDTGDLDESLSSNNTEGCNVDRRNGERNMNIHGRRCSHVTDKSIFHQSLPPLPVTTTLELPPTPNRHLCAEMCSHNRLRSQQKRVVYVNAANYPAREMKMHNSNAGLPADNVDQNQLPYWSHLLPYRASTVPQNLSNRLKKSETLPNDWINTKMTMNGLTKPTTRHVPNYLNAMPHRDKVTNCRHNIDKKSQVKPLTDVGTHMRFKSPPPKPPARTTSQLEQCNPVSHTSNELQNKPSLVDNRTPVERKTYRDKILDFHKSLNHTDDSPVLCRYSQLYLLHGDNGVNSHDVKQQSRTKSNIDQYNGHCQMNGSCLSPELRRLHLSQR